MMLLVVARVLCSCRFLELTLLSKNKETLVKKREIDPFFSERWSVERSQ